MLQGVGLFGLFNVICTFFQEATQTILYDIQLCLATLEDWEQGRRLTAQQIQSVLEARVRVPESQTATIVIPSCRLHLE